MHGRPARVLIVRGHQATPWELRPFELLPKRFDVRYLLTPLNAFDVRDVGLKRVAVKTVAGLVPPRRAGAVLTRTFGDRYVALDQHLDGVAIVHAEELSYWFTAEAARCKRRLGYRLVATVWETLPLLDAYRNAPARRRRRETLAAVDVFLAATERARDALLMEGVAPDRIRIAPPGIDVARFSGEPKDAPQNDHHVIVSPGRLVWEKGHQDVIRAVAAIRKRLIAAPRPAAERLRLLLIGSGSERSRLEAHARELGIGDAVDFDAVPYTEMPRIYARASCMVLASLPAASCSLFIGDPPRCFWEEQFGLVLVEAMAAGLPIVAAISGAIPEVGGDSVDYFAPGDWKALAQKLAEGPLSRPPGTRVEHARERIHRYSATAAADRLAAAYDGLLADRIAPTTA